MKSKATSKRSQQKNYNILFIALVILSFVIVSITLGLLRKNTDNQTNLNAQVASSGWLSGASCEGVEEGSTAFASWRGSPVTIAGTWNDATLDDQTNQWSLTMKYGDWGQSIDNSVGGFYGSNWATAANGGHDANWRAALTKINEKWGNKKTVFIRYAHEFNGSWYQWKVTPSDNENYKKAFARFYNMVQTELVSKGRDAKVVWSPNSDEHNGVNTRDSWPGDQYVDVVGVDFYDWDILKDQAAWDQNFNKQGTYGGPAGIGAWQAFAKSHGKPIAFPEWGTTGYGPVDDPFFVKKMNEFFRANAGTGPGQVWYEIYFNCGGDDWKNDAGKQKFQIYPVADLPGTSAMYKSLTWGDGGINSVTKNPTATLPVSTVAPSLITPTLYCGGSSYCVPSTTITPTGTGQQITPTDQISIEPTSDDTQMTPAPTNSPSQNPTNGNNTRGVFRLFFSFLLALLQFLLQLLGFR